MSWSERLATAQDDFDLLNTILQEWIDTDVSAAARWVLAMRPPDLQLRLAPLVARRLAASDEGAALDFIATLQIDASGEPWATELIARWSAAHPDDALEWARQLPHGELRRWVMMYIGYRWVERDPRAAARYAQETDTSHPLLLTTIATKWAQEDPHSAASWAAGLSDAELRRRVLPSLAAVWAQVAPVEAARFVASLPPGTAQAAAAISVAAGWARHDARTAAEWVSRFPLGKTQDDAYIQVIAVWGQIDPVAAGEWTDRLPEGTARDAAIDTFASVIAERYPSVAFALAETISAEDERSRRLEQVARHWLRIAPEEAGRAIADSTLPTQVLRRLFWQRGR